MNDMATTGPDDAPARAARLAPMLDAAAARIEAARELPPDVLAAMHDARMFRLLLPKSLGGDELDLRTFVRALETLASGDASTAWVTSQGAGCAMAAAFLRPDVARRWFGAPDAVLAWGAGVQGTAVRVEGGYRVTGKWAFASGSRHATLLGGHSHVVDEAGAAILRPNGRPLDRTALLRRDQAAIEDVWDVLGLAGTGSDSFAVKDLFVAEEDTIDRDNTDDLFEDGPLYKFPATTVYGFGFAALQAGIARAMLAALHDLAMTKTPRGVAMPLRHNPVFHSDIARLEARLRAARAYLLNTADEVYRASDRQGAVTIQNRADMKLASVHVIHACLDVTTDAYKAAGSTAIFNTGPYARRLRDALTASQQTQARAQNFVTLGQMMMGLEPDNMLFL